jgi:hypothetical protein
MQHIVLIFNIYLTNKTSFFLTTFRGNYNKHGRFHIKIQYVHFFQITISMVVWSTPKIH